MRPLRASPARFWKVPVESWLETPREGVVGTGLTPAKRRLALEQLGRDRLSELTKRYALDVGDKRVVENHVNALMRSRTVDFGEVLRTLKREELVTICEALGLDQSGREKDALI